MTKTLSIIIPTYNYGSRLAEAVKSVVSQLRDDDELLIVDDGSTDDTQQVIDGLNKQFPGKLSCFKQENSGVAAARNVGIAKSFGRYVVLLDADDELMAGALDALHQAIESSPSIELFVAGHQTADEQGVIRKHAVGRLSKSKNSNVLAYWDKKLTLSHGAFAVKKELFKKISYPESLRGSEDIPVFVHLFALADAMAINCPLVQINKHANSLRRQISENDKALTELVEEVFNPNTLPPELMKYKQKYSVKRALSLSRSHFNIGNFQQARFWFHQAVKLDLFALYNWSYLRKYVKSYFQ